MKFTNDRKEILTEIFFDTKRFYQTNSVLIDACEKSTRNQRFYKENDKINITKSMLNKYEKSAEIIVSQKRSLEAASFYAKKGILTAVHNFASSFNPGGGVLRGSSAQEECLCRCSTLYYSLNDKSAWDNFYLPHRQNINGLHNDDIIYTPKAKVFKSDVDFPELVNENQWYDVNVITCAAPNLYSYQEQNEKVTIEELTQIHIRRISRILDVAVLNGNDAVILGAFGCGAFGNPAKIVAQVSKEVISNYLHSFKFIEFAIFCSPQKKENFIEFNKIFD